MPRWLRRAIHVGAERRLRLPLAHVRHEHEPQTITGHGAPEAAANLVNTNYVVGHGGGSQDEHLDGDEVFYDAMADGGEEDEGEQGQDQVALHGDAAGAAGVGACVGANAAAQPQQQPQQPQQQPQQQHPEPAPCAALLHVHNAWVEDAIDLTWGSDASSN